MKKERKMQILGVLGILVIAAIGILISRITPAQIVAPRTQLVLLLSHLVHRHQEAAPDLNTHGGRGQAAFKQYLTSRDPDTFAQVKQEFMAGFQESPTDAELHLQYGNILVQKGQIDDPASSSHSRTDIAYVEALAQYQEAVRLAPKDPSAHAGLAGVLNQLGRLPEAVQEQEQVIRLAPNDAYSHFVLAALLVANGKKAAGDKEYHKVISMPYADDYIREESRSALNGL